MSDNRELLQDVDQRLANQKKNRCVDVELVRVLVVVSISQQELIVSLREELIMMREQLRHLGIR